MAHDAEAVRARAEASFRKPEPADDAKSQAEREASAQREKTERLREARLAQEALKQKGADIRKSRKRES